jgi:hypothetical protein
VVASSQKLRDNYAETLVMLPAFHPTASSYNSFNSALRAPQYVTLGLQPVVKFGSMLQLRGEFHCFMPWRKVEETRAVDNVPPLVGTTYGKWFHDPEFFGELAAVYALPFAHFTAYANYCSSPGSKWNVGISFGLFFLAPQFMQ